MHHCSEGLRRFSRRTHRGHLWLLPILTFWRQMGWATRPQNGFFSRCLAPKRIHLRPQGNRWPLRPDQGTMLWLYVFQSFVSRIWGSFTCMIRHGTQDQNSRLFGLITHRMSDQARTSFFDQEKGCHMFKCTQLHIKCLKRLKPNEIGDSTSRYAHRAEWVT